MKKGTQVLIGAVAALGLIAPFFPAYAVSVASEPTISPADKVMLNQALDNLKARLFEMQRSVAAREQSVSLDQQQVEALAGALTALQGALVQARFKLAGLQVSIETKVALVASLDNVRTSLLSISSTLPPVAVASAVARVAAQPTPVVAEGSGAATSEKKATDEQQTAQLAPLTSDAGLAGVAPVNTGVDERRLTWQMTVAIIVVVALVAWFRRRGKQKVVAARAVPASGMRPIPQTPLRSTAFSDAGPVVRPVAQNQPAASASSTAFPQPPDMDSMEW